jgi:epoxyqueuosine reductase
MSDKRQVIRNVAKELGFTYVGFAVAEHMDEEARRLEAWLNAGHHGQMTYMENHFDMRTDPRQLVPGAKSVISLLFNYHTDKTQHDPDAPKISRYAYGKDYHKVIRKRLKQLLQQLRERFGDISGRGFVDSAPVLERDWARRAGNGWIGKNTMLIHPKAGSYFFLAELITDLELEPDAPMKDYCGTCTRCIEACPTDAISPDGYILDGSKCISYLTIELKDAIPEEFTGKMESWMFGCDICQDVCPWNRFAMEHDEPLFEPKAELLEKSRREWMEITEDIFDKLFEGSAVRRTKYKGLRRNLDFLKGG